MVKIPEGWKKTTLRELIEIKHGFAFKGEYISDIDNGKVLLTPGNFLIGGGWKEGKKRYTGEIPSDYILKGGDLVVTMTDLSKDGDTLGYPALIPNDENRIFLHNQRIGYITINNEKIDKIFLYYLMRSREYQKFIVNFASGSTVRHTSPDRIRSYEFFLPTKNEQKIIAKTLSAFDDKIELLRAENQTLEEIGQTLFKEWFGKYKVGDELPDGWKVGKLGEEFDISIGRTPPRAESEWFSTNSKDKKRISIKDMVNSGPYIFSTSEYLTKEAVNKFNIPRIPENTTILSFKMTVGKLAITTEEMLSNEAIAHLKIKNNSKLYSEFIYLYLQNLDFNTLGSTSSIVTAINSTIIKEMNFVIPDNDTLSKFSEIIKPIFKKIKINSKEIESLSNTRDQLLPKLMSGEVRVKF